MTVMTRWVVPCPLCPNPSPFRPDGNPRGSSAARSIGGLEESIAVRDWLQHREICLSVFGGSPTTPELPAEVWEWATVEHVLRNWVGAAPGTAWQRQVLEQAADAMTTFLLVPKGPPGRTHRRSLMQ